MKLDFTQSSDLLVIPYVVVLCAVLHQLMPALETNMLVGFACWCVCICKIWFLFISYFPQFVPCLCVVGVYQDKEPIEVIAAKSKCDKSRIRCYCIHSVFGCAVNACMYWVCGCYGERMLLPLDATWKVYTVYCERTRTALGQGYVHIERRLQSVLAATHHVRLSTIGSASLT